MGRVAAIVLAGRLGGPDFAPGAGNAFANWARLPRQFVFVAWAWWYTRPEGERCGGRAPADVW